MERYQTLPEAGVDASSFLIRADPFASCISQTTFNFEDCGKVYPKSKRKAQESNTEATGSIYFSKASVSEKV